MNNFILFSFRFLEIFTHICTNINKTNKKKLKIQQGSTSIVYRNLHVHTYMVHNTICAAVIEKPKFIILIFCLVYLIMLVMQSLQYMQVKLYVEEHVQYKTCISDI